MELDAQNHSVAEHGHVGGDEVDLAVDTLASGMIADECHDAISGVDQLLDLGRVTLPGTNPFEPGLPNAIDAYVGGALGLPVEDALEAGVGHRCPSLRGDGPKIVVTQGLGNIDIGAGE